MLTSNSIQIDFNSLLKPLFTTKKRYVILTGGRGSGKSYAVTLKNVLDSYKVYNKTLFTRYTLTSAHISIIPEYISKIQLLNQLKTFNINKTEITNLKTGNEILFRGIRTSSGNQTANLKSIEGINNWILDEAEELTDIETFNKIDESIRTLKADNQIILVLNPSYKTHFIYDYFFKNYYAEIDINGFKIETTSHPDVEHIHLSYLNNLKNLNESFVKKATETLSLDPQAYRHRFLGGWIDQPEGILFDYNSLKRFELSQLNENYISTIAFCDVADEGNDYLCMVIGKVYDNKIFIIDVVFSYENSEVTKPIILNKIQQYNITHVVFESNNMGATYGKDIRTKVQRGVNVYLWGNYTNKETRILMFAEHVKELFYFRSDILIGSEYYRYLSQLTSYLKSGDNKHDDAPDATTGLAMFYLNHFSKLQVNKTLKKI